MAPTTNELFPRKCRHQKLLSILPSRGQKCALLDLLDNGRPSRWSFLEPLGIACNIHQTNRRSLGQKTLDAEHDGPTEIFQLKVKNWKF